jgi:hypothetical protein
MNLSRLLPIFLLFAAPVCRGQLPPSILQPGRPVTPAPRQPVTAVPTAPIPGSAIPAVPAEIAALAPNTLTPQQHAEGWRLLFDGQRGYGIRGVQKADPLAAGWKILGGQLILPKEVKDMDQMTGGDLITMDQFWDFDFRFEWKATVSADSGIRYMLSESSGQTPVGLEYQIIDDVHNTTSLKGGPLRRTGALDNVLPVGANAKLRTADPLNNVGDPWNEGRIVVQGIRVEHWLNGEKVLEFDLGPNLRRLAEANKMRVPASYGMKNRTRICILDQGTEIAFRNLKIRPLVPQAVLMPAPGTSPTQPGGTVPNPLLLPPGSGTRR